MTRRTRRGILRAVGAGLVASVSAFDVAGKRDGSGSHGGVGGRHGGGHHDGSHGRGEWTTVDVPTARTLHDVVLDGTGTVVLAGDDGALLAGSGGNWERETPAAETLQDVEVGNCGCVHAVGASGTVVHRTGHGTPGITALARWFDWWRTKRPTGENLQAIAIGPPHVAAGAAGTIIER